MTDDLRKRRLEVIREHMATGQVFDGDRIVNERIYFDSASLVTQIGRAELLSSAGTDQL